MARKNKLFLFFITITLLCIVASSIIYLCYGHRLIEKIYRGESIEFLNRQIEGQQTNPLEFYLIKADQLFLIILFIFSIFSVSIYLFINKKGEIFLLIREELSFKPSTIKTKIRLLIKFLSKNKKLVLSVIILFILFYSIYFSIGILLSTTSAFKEYDILFEADTPRAIEDLAVFSGNHDRTAVHPIYVLLVNPFGSLLNILVKSHVVTAVGINSFFGAFGVVLAFVFFWLFSEKFINPLLLTSVFGLSMSQIFFSVAPDTYSLAVCSLIVTYILFLISLKRRRLYLPIWVLAGIFTIGVNTTNFIQTLICFIVTVSVLSKDERKNVSILSSLLTLIIIVVLSTSFLSLIQKAIYPSSILFFVPWAYQPEIAYTSLKVLSQPFPILIQLMKHFFLVNFIAPFPDVFTMSDRLAPAITYSSSWDYSFIGWVCVAIWLILLFRGLLKSLFYKQEKKTFFIGISLCLIFNLIFHSIYGKGSQGQTELFLYTGNFTFLILLFLSNYSTKKNQFLMLILGTLALLMGLNNLLVIKEIINIY